MSSPSVSRGPATPSPGDDRLASARSRYTYRPAAENWLSPISLAKSWPWMAEQYGPSWVLPFLPRYLLAQARHLLHNVRFGLQRAAFRFEKLKAYSQILPSSAPPFMHDPLDHEGNDAYFAWWRVAGANPLLLGREGNLTSLRRRIPLDVERVEGVLSKRLARRLALEEEARAGRLFAVDFRLIQSALRPEAGRDSRWRETYLPAPIGVFLEAPGFYDESDLVPLAIQIDQPQPDSGYNPVYYADGSWGWRIACAYFEAADVTYQAAVGHDLRCHFALEPFAMATPRQLPPRHPVRILLEPHLRYTLRANRAAYQYCVDRSKLYDEIYSGSLEEFRALAVQGYLERPFPNLRFEDDLAKRGVADTPRVYPYRDDLRLWRDPIREFVEQYLGSCYASDESVRGDGSLQGWIAELMDGERGRICRLLPGDRLDSRAELIQLLTQVLFTAGPSHASQHFSACVLYRHAPTFAAGVYAPPPGPEERLDFPRWLSMLPPIEAASDQLRSNTFTNFQYDRFGHYGRYRLGRLPEARQAVRRLQEELTRIERIIEARQEGRLFRYEFVLPSRVPNSVNI